MRAKLRATMSSGLIAPLRYALRISAAVSVKQNSSLARPAVGATAFAFFVPNPGQFAMGMAQRKCGQRLRNHPACCAERVRRLYFRCFSVIADDVSGFARTGGRSTEEICIWLSPP